MCDVIVHAVYMRVCVREAFLKEQHEKQKAKFGNSSHRTHRDEFHIN